MNFSETTFVMEESRAADGAPQRARVRIFTPHEELPFAGHPTLGTAWVIGGGAGPVRLELGVGAVDVAFEDGVAWMIPPAGRHGDALAPTAAAAFLGIDSADLDEGLGAAPIECGIPYMLIGVRDLATLGRIRVDAAGHGGSGGHRPPFVVCRGGYSGDADFAARMLFFDGVGTREDPATGSANAAFAHYLAARGERGRFVVEQGFAIGRPSRIYLDIGAAVRVGGKVQPVLDGTLL
jgi:trans-2,3-dihydro-3-hydroxyanthranilate isomerase